MSDGAKERFRDFVTLTLDPGKLLGEERERSLIGDGIARFKLEGDVVRGVMAVAAAENCQVVEREVLRSMLAIMRELAGKRAAIDKRRFAQGLVMLKAISNGQLADAEARAWLKRLVEQAEFRICRSGLLRSRRWFRKIKSKAVA